MRIIVMFDLPTLTVEDNRNYRQFRKFLIKSGFIMMQESIYTKLALNPSSAELYRKQVRKAIPKDGLVQMLTITEKQFQDMELLLGKTQTACLDSDKRFVKI
ncbi:MAG: CRISPR-associated endonuclease Cas2 [Eubacteriales bacterium]|nr:CRISPR-associated endonuclease Cas2 [Eubacteriales bacterium]